MVLKGGGDVRPHGDPGRDWHAWLARAISEIVIKLNVISQAKPWVWWGGGELVKYE